MTEFEINPSHLPLLLLFLTWFIQAVRVYVRQKPGITLTSEQVATLAIAVSALVGVPYLIFVVGVTITLPVWSGDVMAFIAALPVFLTELAGVIAFAVVVVQAFYQVVSKHLFAAFGFEPKK
jgi:hypothetical protein